MHLTTRESLIGHSVWALIHYAEMAMELYIEILWMPKYNVLALYLDDNEPVKGALKHGTPRCRRRLNACSVNFTSEAGSMRQNEPLPGSS